MVMLNHTASDVYTTITDMSEVIRIASTTVGACVLPSKRGPMGLTFVGDRDTHDLLFGPVDTTVGMGHAVNQDFLEISNNLWVNRVIGSGFMYAGRLVVYDSAAVPGSQILLRSYGITGADDPSDTINFVTAGTPSGTETNLAYIHAIGPGAYYNNYAVDIVSDNIQPPAVPTGSFATTGGTLAAATYNYVVTAVTARGETMASPPCVITVSATSTAVNTVDWAPVAGAVGYKIYGRASGSLFLMGTVDSLTTVFTDNGSIVPNSLLIPPVAGPAVNTLFTLRVFDLTQSVNSPVEVHQVSIALNTDGFGNQSEIENVVNKNSNYIRVVSNRPNLGSIPTITSVAQQQLGGGVDGAAASVSQIAAAWDDFSNKDEVRVTVLLNAGFANPTIQNAMISLAEARRDSFAVIDVPDTDQASQNAINYRNATLNADTTRAILCTPSYKRVDTDSGQEIWVPLSGKVGACMAYTDFVQSPGWSFAGKNRGFIRGALDLRYRYNSGERDNLASAQVSYARRQNGVGTYLNEQLTLQRKFSAMSFASVRRIFDVIEAATTEALSYFLHENNQAYTIARIQGMLTIYLESLKSDYTILNYAIQLDTTPATRGQGILGIKIRIEPTLPINQIALNLIVTRQGEVEFEEVV